MHDTEGTIPRSHSACELSVCQMNGECSAATEKGGAVLRNRDAHPASVSSVGRWIRARSASELLVHKVLACLN